MNKESMRRNKKELKVYLQFTLLMFAVFLAAFFLLAYPEQTSNGVSDGLKLCLCVVVPSLYPFMVLSSFFVESSLCQMFSKIFEKITRFVFALPGVTTSVILLSLVGGFPVGVSMTASLFKKKQINRETGKRLLLFCIGPGPGFVIGAVGTNMLGSKKAGILLYASVVLSSLVIGFLTRFICGKSDEDSAAEKIKKPEASNALVEAVSKSTNTMLIVCGWILLFSSLIELLDVFPLSQSMRLLLTSLLEVTRGCREACGILSIPVISGIIGWGGLSTHFQLMPFIKALGLKMKFFWTFRAVNGALALLICQMLLNFFPIEEEVVLQTGAKVSAFQGSSVVVSLSMFAMCLLFLFGNNFVVQRKKTWLFS